MTAFVGKLTRYINLLRAAPSPIFFV